MRILHSVCTLTKEGGGLSVAVADLCSNLTGDGRSIEVVSNDPPDADRIAMSESVGVIPIGSLGEYQARLEAEMQREEIPLIHQNGIWHLSSREAAKFARKNEIPIVWAPHGMLEPWALKFHRWKKRIAWIAYQNAALRRAVALHATADSEADQIRSLGFSQPIAVLPNGVLPRPETPEDPEAVDRPKERKVALFLSRVHPKKGIPMLLEAWARLRPTDWELVIAGPDEANHVAELKAQVQQLNLESEVSFPGAFFGKDKDTVFRRADLFVLPTYSENFGIVVTEALQYGVPVLTTTGAPWSELEENSCGWWVEPTVDAITPALEDAVSRSDSEREEMGRNGMALIDQKYRWPKIGEEMIAFYQWILGNGEKPACVRE